LIRAVDVTGNNATDWLFIRVDSSPPIFMSHTFEKNVDSGDPKLSYSSRCVNSGGMSNQTTFVQNTDNAFYETT